MPCCKRRAALHLLGCGLLGLAGLRGAPAAHAQGGTPIHVVQYTVQGGDTMGAIAEYFYQDQTRAPGIAAFNHLANVNRIGVGQPLDIPFYDPAVWRAYATRTGQPTEPAGAVTGGSEDVAVAPAKGGPGAGRRLWAMGAYGFVALLLTAALYWRSRRHAHTALGVGSARR